VVVVGCNIRFLDPTWEEVVSFSYIVTLKHFLLSSFVKRKSIDIHLYIGPFKDSEVSSTENRISQDEINRRGEGTHRLGFVIFIDFVFFFQVNVN
jgi:hypothetical protein